MTKSESALEWLERELGAVAYTLDGERATTQTFEVVETEPGTTPTHSPTGRELDQRLHEYQRRAVAHLHKNDKAGLFLEMGLGKTATVLQSLESYHLPALVIAPKRVAENVWTKEASIWRPEFSIEVAAGTATKRGQALNSDADIVVIGRDNIKDVPAGKFKTIVLDELSSFKSRGSQRWKIAKQLTDHSPYVWGLTGTPAPNGLIDLWPQIFLLDRGERLGKTLTAYRNRYFSPGRQLPNGVITNWLTRKESPENIHRLLSDICLSMKSVDHLDLPPVTYNRVEVSLDQASKKVYNDMITHLVAQLEEGAVVAANAAVVTGKLSQITAGFLYDEEGNTNQLHTKKIDALSEIIDGTGSPVLVFYRFKAEKQALLDGFPQARTVDEKGVLDAWDRGEVPMLLAHPDSAGHGLNLQAGGHTIVWMTPTWALESYLQANARLARQGQQNPVVVHQIVVPGSVDERIYSVLEGKTTVQGALMDALRRA